MIRDRSPDTRSFGLRFYAAAVVVAVSAGVGLPSAEAAPIWRTRGYEMVQTHAHGFFEGTDLIGFTERDPTQVRFEVQWMAPSGKRAGLNIYWAISCYSEDSGREWYREGWIDVRIGSGDKVTRSIDARLNFCDLRVGSFADHPIPAGRLKVWVKELS